MLEQESAVQVEGGKGRVHCLAAGPGPYKGPGAAVARPHLPLQFHLGVLRLGLCPAEVCRDQRTIWGLLLTASGPACFAQHRPRDSVVLATELFHFALYF